MQSRHRVVKWVMRGAGAYFLYTIVQVANKERVLDQARVIREQQIRYGGDFELSEQKKEILRKADQYLDNHTGYRYLNRMRTEDFFEQQFTKKIKQKEEALAQTNPQEKETIEKLKSHIDQLNKAYKSMLPKMPTSWEDLKEKDEDDE